MADNDIADPQITKGGKIAAGILLILFTVFSIIIIIAFWPDRLPEPGKKCALYRYHWFAMTLDTNACNLQHASAIPAADTLLTKTVTITKTDTATDTSVQQPSLAKTDSSLVATPAKAAASPVTHAYINLNIILLLLVATGGFLGNMIHVATSFTTFVGAGKFQQSWILWYFVRPFTASALALALYFAFGATNDPANADIDRILTLAILSGLFTDIATQKLKEVFDVLFSPKDNRPNKLNDPTISITSTSPDELAKEGDNHIVIKGSKLTSQKLIIKIDDQPIVDTQITDQEITFTYTIPEEAKDKTELMLLITDAEGNTILHKKMLAVTENAAPPPAEGTEDAEEKAVG
ncbi:hypothetical protein D3H65_27280 [Paraflavitalea soli]|uniref:IPT/TIG domain-containing protein n=1 Tax=Paraflavitalea soli TaxID=2315862 RepID=A0A3B7MTL6_9BACT|nr:IPT/TIG domain-containing protein [Paraflavitalea soli]AXY77458.1 hypothetical protein D3H65_27280 [Paraflavitalea soli]